MFVVVVTFFKFVFVVVSFLIVNKCSLSYLVLYS